MRRIYWSILLVLICLSANSVTFAQIEYADKMANTIMNQYKDSMVMKKFAQHLQQDNQLKSGQSVEEAQKQLVWSYDVGICLMGFERLYEQTGDKKYIEYIKHILDYFIEKDGTIKTYVLEDYSSDSIPNGRQILKLYEVYKDEKYKLAAQSLRNQISLMPRNKVGGFWHKLK